MPYDLVNDTGLVSFMPVDTTSAVVDTRLNASGQRVCYSWQAERTGNIGQIQMFISNTSGTLTNIGRYELYNSNSSLLPTGSIVVSGTFTPTGSRANTLSIPGSFSVTASSFYCFVLRNLNAAPQTNWYDVPNKGLPSDRSHAIVTSATSGQQWGSIYYTYPFWQFQYSDGGVWGPHPMRQALGTASDSNTRIYNTAGSRRGFYGVALKWPYRVAIYSVEAQIRAVGTLASAGQLTVHCYSGSTLVASSSIVSSYQATSNESKPAYFDPPAKVNAGEECYLVYTQSITGTAGTASNYYNLVGANHAAYSATGFNWPVFGYHSVLSTGTAIVWTIPASNSVPWIRINYKILSNRGSI